MREQWQNLSERFGALQVRERILILVGVVVGTALVFDSLAFQPAQARKKLLERQIVEARDNLKRAADLMKTKQSVGDSAAVKRTYRDALRGRLAEVSQNLTNLQDGLVPPERMARLLGGVLSETHGLQLLSLRALPPQRFDSGGEAGPAPAAGKTAKPEEPKKAGRTIYKHSFEITLQGGYSDVYDYLSRLEKLPWKMFWSRLSVETERYPRLRVTLTVQTLSLTEAWLIV